MGYCVYMTNAGYALQAKLFAEGGNLDITKVMVGAGILPEDTPPEGIADLIHPMAAATSTKPRREGCEVSLIIEYRSEFNSDMERPFQISEFGVFAIGVDGEEALILYGDLSDCPDTAVPLKYGGCVRRYPVNITVGPDTKASLQYPAGAWATWEEVDEAVGKALEKGLDMGDGVTVPEAMGAVKDKLARMEMLVNGLNYYRVFELSDWTGNQLRIPAAEHGMEPKHPACIYTLRARVGRSAREYDEGSAAPVAVRLIETVQAALAANASAPGTFPTAEDGHVLLTWEQVQYVLLEGTLVPAGTAETKAAELGFGAWKNRDNGTEPTVTLDQLLTAAYLPALGGPSAPFQAMVTAEALQGLRFRRGTAGDGYAARYDLDGRFVTTWGTMSGEVYWDVATKELVLKAGTPFPGDLLVMGRADAGQPITGTSTGLSQSGAGGSLPVATPTTPGAVKPGPGLTVAADGTLSVDFASDAEVNKMLAEALAPDNK